MGRVLRTSYALGIWEFVFVVAGLFQVYRGAPLDGSYFLLAVLFMVLLDKGKFENFQISNSLAIKIYFILNSLVLSASRIHTVPSLLSIFLFLPLISFSVNGERSSRALSTPQIQSAGIWAALAVFVALYEMLSYIVGNLTHRPLHYPTISMLVDPMLHNVIGRVFFVMCWSFLGFKFIFQRSKN